MLVALDRGAPDYAEGVGELTQLAASARVQTVALVEGRRQRPEPSTYAGRGKVEEIAAVVAREQADVVIFNNALSPGQERNLERALDCRVIDRTSLILDIFAQRARSHEGKLQVELAQLEHLATRLRGPGETQLETDRRLLGKRVKVLKEKLAHVAAQRTTQRRARSRGQVFSVSLVGYTNAGKSTLFNALTRAGSYAADQLFATLDTTSRRIRLPSGTTVVVSDTVGFIRDLPHTLVAAFHATLDEAVHADLLLHVVDASSPVRDTQIAAVEGVLGEIGAGDVPQVMVYNKVDLTAAAPREVRDEHGKIRTVWISAAERLGLDFVRHALDERVSPGSQAAPLEASRAA